MSLKAFGNALIRRKTFGALSADTPAGEGLTPTQLKRCLSTLDLTALGIGSTLGLGIYVLAGTVASTKAGPAVVLSFAIAALTSVFAGLCYAEFAARVPRAGSAYVYSYVTVGELMAFIIGWNLILEYVIGTASVARGYSGYIDSLADGAIARWFRSFAPMNVGGMSAYPDFLALGLTLLLTAMLAIGVEESTKFNSIFTGLNLVVVLYVVICGAFKADLKNWELPEDEVPADTGGKGGFFPFGFKGMMSGAATAFFGFVGFDIIASTGEEVKNPQKSMPISIVLSLTFIFLAYFGISIVQTLMWPYWDQNNNAPLPYVFDKVGWPVAKYVINIGGLAGLSTSLLGSLFPLPRVLYAMASDGLIFRWLGWVNARTQTPLLSTIFSGFFAGGMAAIFNIDELADMMSIGTLLAYTLVAVCVLILRFQYDPPQEVDLSIKKGVEESDEGIDVQSVADFLRICFNTDGVKRANRATSRYSIILISWTCLQIVILNIVLYFCEDTLSSLQWGPLSAVIFNVILILLGGVALARQPRAGAKLPFQVPWVPTIPLLSCFVNVYLMLKLSQATWIRFGVWMLIGFVIYFFYGLRNSEERIRPEALIQPNESQSEDGDGQLEGGENLEDSYETARSRDPRRDNAGQVVVR